MHCALCNIYIINITYLRPWASYWCNYKTFVIFRCFSCQLVKKKNKKINSMQRLFGSLHAICVNMLHSWYKYYVSSSLSILLMQFQNICHFHVVFMPTRLKSTQCNECLTVCINYALCVNMLHSYYKYYVSSSLSILLMQFQNICHFQVVFMPSSLKSA